MATSNTSELAADPDKIVRTTVAIPENLWHGVALLAQRNGCPKGDVHAEALEMLFASIRDDDRQEEGLRDANRRDTLRGIAGHEESASREDGAK